MGIDDVVLSVRRCWASVFTDRAVEYRNRHKIKHGEAVMSVVIQEMINPDVAGTAFSLELSTGFPAIHVTASYGIGEAVVSGEVTADEWLVEKNDLGGSSVGQNRIVKRVLGSKLSEFRPRKQTVQVETPGMEDALKTENVSGIEQLEVSKARRENFCMETPMVQDIGRAIQSIAALYNKLFGYGDVDTEFGVVGNAVRLLQSRPVVELDRGEVKTVSLKKLQRGAAPRSLV